MAALEPGAIGAIVGGVAGVSEWIATARATRATWRSGTRSGERIETTTQVVVFRDERGGRAHASFRIDVADPAHVELLAAEAVERAGHGAGPPWSLPPAAAPARVRVADRAIAGDPTAERDAALADLRRGLPPGIELEARAVTELSQIAVATSTGFASAYSATRIAIDAALSRGGGVARLVCAARRRRDLALAPAIAAAAARTEARAGAAPLPAGRYDLVLIDDAITAEAAIDATAAYSWFAPIVAQADGAAARQGLSRYLPGQSIFGERPATGDPIGIASDGALTFGLHSRPFADQGEPTRRFELVRGGIAAGLALDVREAALRRELPNGGVRNLAVASGPTSAADLIAAANSPLVVEELEWLDVDPSTGDAVAELGLSRAGGERRPSVGGIVVANVFDLLARARLSSERRSRGWYRGPRAIAIGGVDVA